MTLDLLACAVCMGLGDAPLAKGMNAGVLVLLGVTGGMLACIGAGVALLARRARLARRTA
jgi:hypothetical protein